jgi:hypothetical protein
VHAGRDGNELAMRLRLIWQAMAVFFTKEGRIIRGGR